MKTEMKQLKDYLHLYLGCECYYDRTHYAGKLIGIEDDSVFTWDTVNGRVAWPLKRMLPIFRNLSDMTEEEYEEAYINWANVHGTPSEAEANRTKYLLSKHFDLFGLIEAGLAIDKTKI